MMCLEMLLPITILIEILCTFKIKKDLVAKLGSFHRLKKKKKRPGEKSLQMNQQKFPSKDEVT